MTAGGMSTFTRLLKLLAPFKWWVAFGVLLSFLTIGSSVGLMAMSAYLISKAALVVDVSDLALAITTVRVFAISRAAFRYLERYFTHTATFRILTQLRVWLFSALEPLAPARLMPYRSGDLLTRSVADIETLENFYVRVIVPPITAVCVTILACLILGVFDTSLASALLIFLVLTGVVLPLLSRWLSQPPATTLIATRADLNALLVDEIQGLPDLIAFDQTQSHAARVLGLSRLLNRTQEQLAMLRGVSSGLAALFTSLAGLTVLLLAIPLVSGGQIEGVYLALLPLTAIASFEAVQPLSLALQQLEASQAAGRRLFELIDTPPAVRDPDESLLAQPRPRGGPPAGTQAPSIAFKDVRFHYNPIDPPALDGVSFSIPAGSRVAIVGSSGSGKSTIVNLLLRFWDYHAGQITLDGIDLRQYRADDVRALIGVVPQNVHLFNATVQDNLLLANPDATAEQMRAACQQAQLHDFIEGLPLKYETLIGENGVLLSGGERQRLAIARAILKGAPILILDEATANLDAITERQLLASLEPFMAGRTVIIITHRRTVIEQVDQVIELEQGRVVGGAQANAPSGPPWLRHGYGQFAPAERDR
jgi:ATP-binding cassette subfamily C protein CydC